jgi:hypothetical protein
MRSRVAFPLSPATGGALALLCGERRLRNLPSPPHVARERGIPRQRRGSAGMIVVSERRLVRDECRGG